MMRPEVFSKNFLESKIKKCKLLGEKERIERCVKHVNNLKDKDFDLYIEGPIRYIQGNSELLKSKKPINHIFRTWILCEAYVAFVYLIPAMNGTCEDFKLDTLEESATYDKVDNALNNLAKADLRNGGCEYIAEQISIILDWIYDAANRNMMSEEDFDRGIDVIIRHYDNFKYQYRHILYL